jgi:hypothetical protein
MFLTTDDTLMASGGFGSAERRVRLPGTALVSIPGGRLARWRAGLRGIDWVPDLGAQIGSRAWWRGLATCTGCAPRRSRWRRAFTVRSCPPRPPH